MTNKIKPDYCHAWHSPGLLIRLDGYAQYSEGTDLFLGPGYVGLCIAAEIPRRITSRLTDADLAELGICRADLTLNIGHYRPTSYDPDLYVDPFTSEVLSWLEIPHEIRNPPHKKTYQEPKLWN